MFVVLKNGDFVRAESLPERAERARLHGFQVHALNVQMNNNGFVGYCSEGELHVSPGLKDWRPKGNSAKSSKKIDRAEAIE